MVGIGGVVGSSGVEHLLHVVLPFSVVLGTHDAELKLEFLVEGELLGIDLGSVVAHVGIAEGTLLLHES